MTNALEHKLLAFAAVVPVSDAGRSLEFYLGQPPSNLKPSRYI